VASIEGKYLHKQQGWGNPEFQWNGWPASVFYLDSDGHMYEAVEGSVMSTDRTDGGAWMQFTAPQYVGNMPKAVCTKGPGFSLSCFQTSTSVITISGSFGADDSRIVTPMFGTPDWSFKPITLTYEDTACPAACVKSASSSTPAPTSTPAPSSTPATSTTSSVPVTSVTPSATPSSVAQCSTSLTFTAPAGSTCFTVTGHGPAHVEGQILGMRPGYTGAVFGWDTYTPATLYRGPDGLVYVASDTFANGWVMSMVSDTGASPWMGFYPTTQVAAQNYPKATCSLNPQSKAFTCSMAGFTTFIVAPIHNFYSATDSRSGNPIFGVPSGPWVSMTMTYNEVPCPVKCGTNSPSSTPTTSATSQPPTLPPSPTSASPSAASPSNPAEESSTPCGGFGTGGIKTVGGKAYNVYCGQTGSAPVTQINAVYLPSFSDCITSCNTLSGCKAVMFREIAPNNGNYQCTRYSAMGLPVAGGLDWTGSFDVAVAQ
jgi:hypothetical protein